MCVKYMGSGSKNNDNSLFQQRPIHQGRIFNFVDDSKVKKSVITHASSTLFQHCSLVAYSLYPVGPFSAFDLRLFSQAGRHSLPIVSIVLRGRSKSSRVIFQPRYYKAKPRSEKLSCSSERERERDGPRIEKN